MKIKARGLLLCVVAALGLMAFRQQAPPPDLSSPKATVRSFVQALEAQDVATMQKCVKGAADLEPLKPTFGSMYPHIAIVSLIEERRDNTAHVALKFTKPSVAGSPKAGVVTMVDMFSLVKVGENWQLMPDSKQAELLTKGENPPMSVMLLLQTRPYSFAVIFTGSPQIAKVFQGARQAARAVSCLSNARQVTLGIMQYTQDYDEILPRKNAAYTELIFPYTKNRDIYTCPSTPEGTISYSLNSAIAGIPLSAIKSPETTVLIYEGKEGKLDYRHDDQAAVGFVDGHCKMVTEAEAEKFIWTVKVPQATKPTKTTKPTKKTRH